MNVTRVAPWASRIAAPADFGMSTARGASAPDFGSRQPWDEMANGRGGLRPGWGAMLATVAGLGPEALTRRADLLDRILTEDGVTGLLPGVDPLAWRCDPLPLLLGAAEFERLETGLAQRARLIEAVLRDVYGPQTLLAEGRIPPALVYANPAFLRPCRDADGGAPSQRMHLYAAEVLRGPDGAWRVVADRTADAAGLAYVLENRRALARALPELFRAHPPRRLAPFFDAWQDALQRLAPPETDRPDADRPGLALLTPGASDKLWFEHVVLARELSCTLVEGSDLTIRDGALCLKTLQGLQRVHVLLRRQDGRTLDPLELDSMQRIGITGLLDAARSGSVRIVNDPGSGCAEAPAWSAMLPGLAHRVLGEELALASVETLWLGAPAAYARVMPALHEWRIRPALDGTVPAIFSPRETGAPADLAQRIAAAPAEFVASAPLVPSLSPCLAANGLQPRPVLLRLFLLFDGEGWRALPGGFARVLTQRDLDCGRLPLHALSKDVWVASEEEQDIVGPSALHSPALPVRRSPGDLPSRVAENFFWLGRNLERLEGAARLLRTALDRLERPGPSPRESAELRTVAVCLGAAGLIEREAAVGLGPAALTERLLQVGAQTHGDTYGDAHGDTRGDRVELPSLLGEVSRLGELLRDRLTREVHSTLTQGLRSLNHALGRLRPGEADEAPSVRDLEHVSTVTLSFAATMAGLAAENMVRSGGRLFLDLGRRVERAWATARTMAQALDQQGAALQPGPLEPGLRLALELCDSVITYRSRYLSTLQPGPVLDLVLADEGNPRAVAFQLAAIRDILAELAGVPGSPLPTAASALLRQVREIARDAASVPERQAAAALPAQLRAVETGVTDLSNQIARRYFAVLPAAHQVGLAEEAPALRGMA